MKRKILIVAGHYLPGYKAGGALRGLVNLIDWLGDEFDFYVLTGDRDLGDDDPYPDIEYGKWHQVGKAQVRHLAPAEQGFFALRSIIREIPHDVLYLNSFFYSFSAKVMLLRWLKQIPAKMTALAPQGEFSPGALALKKGKKNAFLWLSKIGGIHRNIRWHVSDEIEAEIIRKRFKGDIFLGANPFTKKTAEKPVPPVKKIGAVSVIFLARLARKKNLDYALRVLSEIKGQVTFNIYGPIEDAEYWAECEKIMRGLPHNITTIYCGAVKPEAIPEIFAQHHLFFFPTRGENFGHTILEALSAGCPALLSDQTPWCNLAEKQAGWDLPLDNPYAFQTIIENVMDMDQDAFNIHAYSAYQYAQEYVHSRNQIILDACRQLFSQEIP